MRADVAIIGGGFAGVSAAFFLSEFASVVLIERESGIGYHSSGRSAEQFTVGITADTMRLLAAASRSFLEEPPAGFSETPFLSPRGCLTVGRSDQEAGLRALHSRLTSAEARAQCVDRAEGLQLFPALREGSFDVGVFEPDAMDIDANALLQSYMRAAAGRGVKLVTGAEVVNICVRAGVWSVQTAAGEFESPRLLNAAGAWVDEVTKLAGLTPIGVTPFRRTAFTFAPPQGVDVSEWPHVSNLDYQWYVKPGRTRLMGSLADAVPTAAGDVYPDDMDVAQAVYNIEQDTTFRIERPLGAWAGLRNFVTDKNPVAGGRDEAPGFFWLAGQGGCGVLTSPALGSAIAAVVLGRDLPPDLKARGLRLEDLSPNRRSLTH